MLNYWVGLGRLTRDPEVKTTGSGVAVANFALAIDRDYKNQDGERGTDFIEIICWRQRADFARRYLQKGRLICVSGRLEQNRWVDDQGNNRSTWRVNAQDIYFAGGKREDPSTFSTPAQEQFQELTDEEKLPF